MAEVHLCPVCNGVGFLSEGFYSRGGGDVDHWVSGGTGSETCRSCEGKGYILLWEDERIEVVNINYEEGKE